VVNIQETIQTECVWEQGADENIQTYEGGSNRKLEETYFPLKYCLNDLVNGEVGHAVCLGAKKNEY
jgi:hypothetical protein